MERVQQLSVQETTLTTVFYKDIKTKQLNIQWEAQVQTEKLIFKWT